MYCGPRATMFYFTQVGSTELDSSVLRNVLLYGVVAVLLRHVVGGGLACGCGRATSEPTALLRLRLSSFAFSSKQILYSNR